MRRFKIRILRIIFTAAHAYAIPLLLSPRLLSWSQDHSTPIHAGPGLGLEVSDLVLGLCLEQSDLVLVLGLEVSGLVLVLGLELSGLVLVLGLELSDLVLVL